MLSPTFLADSLTLDTAMPFEFVPRTPVELVPWIGVALTANLRHSPAAHGSRVVVSPIRQSVEVTNLEDKLNKAANLGQTLSATVRAAQYSAEGCNRIRLK